MIASLFGTFGGPSRAEFYRDLASTLSTGIPIAEAVALVARRRFPSGAASRVMTALSEAVQAREPLSNAMERQPESFPLVDVAFVRAGEQSGKIEESLRFATRRIEAQIERRRKLFLGLAYPTFLLHGVLALVPLASNPGGGFGAGYSFRVFTLWLALDGGVLLLVWLHRRSSRRAGYVEFLRRIPGIGRVWIETALARYLRALSALYGAGSPLREATRLAAMAAAEPTLEASLDAIVSGVERGEPLASHVRSTGRFPDEVCRSLDIGEETGTLAEKLDRSAAFLEERADRMAGRVIQVVAKLAYAIAAISVLFVAVSFYGRMFSELG